MTALRPWLLAALLLSTLLPTSISADPFERNKVRIAIRGGSGTAFNETYFVLGGGVGYFPLDGLEIGVDGESWMGSNPGLYKISPQVRYILPRGDVKPYLGVLYRRTWIEGQLSDLNSIGGRAGAYLSLGGNVQSGLGVVYERYLNCDEKTYTDCSTLTPEIDISVSF